jgi:hypothetical protein
MHETAALGSAFAMGRDGAKLPTTHSNVNLLVSRGQMDRTPVSWLGKLQKAQADMAARNADPWRLPLERIHAESVMTASSALPPRWFSIFWKSPSEAVGQALVVVLRRLWQSWGGPL